MEYFGVSPIAFAGLFAANIVALMIFNRLNVRVLRRVGPRSILPVGLAMQATAALALVLYVFLGDPRLALVAPLIVLAVGPLGLVGANAMASYLAFFPKGTATANAILGASQYGFGALVGAGLGAIHDGTLRTLGAGMFGCSALALIAYFTLVRRRRPGRKDPQGTGRPGAE
jgi:DHA1 family bicyclomycin/chloramphenicol resistance-like MFS transporter